MTYNAPDQTYDAPDDGDGSKFTNEQISRLQALSFGLTGPSKAGLRLSPIAQALREFCTGPQVAFPTAAPVRQITGDTYYVNPAVAGPGAGTFADPFKSLTAALAEAGTGDGVLIIEGGTTAALSGTLNLPDGIVLGVYNAAYGARVSNKVGAATINCGGIAAAAISGANKTTGVCVEGINFTNNAAGQWCVQFTGTSANCQILRCRATSGLYHFSIQASGAGHNIEFNETIDAGDFAILREVLADDLTSTVSFNRVIRSAVHGIFIGDSGGGFKFSGRAQANYFYDGGVGSGSSADLKVWSGGGAPKVTHNYGRGGRHGIWVQTGSSAGPADFTGYINESNDFAFYEFPYYQSRTMGDWVVQHNSYTDAGVRLDGVTPVSAEAYARCMEFYGNTFADRVVGGTVRFNYVARARSHFRASNNFPGTEGVGVGLDNNCFGVTVYGNYSERNEGQGLQCNTGAGNIISGNWSVDDACAPPAAVANWPDEAKAAIHHSFNPGSYIGNNTIIMTGRIGQKHGVTEMKAENAASVAAVVVNNVIVGATGSAITRQLTSTEAGNLAINCGGLVTSATTELPIAASASTRVGSTADIDVGNPFYPPVPGGGADNTGEPVPPGLVSGRGELFGFAVPRGALHAVTASIARV